MFRIPLFVPLLVVVGVASPGGFAQDRSDSPSGLERSGRGFLGVGLPRRHFDLDLEFVVIFEVVAGSPAERAGLKVGDRIVSVDGVKVADALDFVQRIKAKKPDDQLKLKVLRDEEQLVVEVTLGTSDAILPRIEPGGGAAGRAFLGVGYGEVPVLLAVHLGLDPGAGVVVGDVRPGSAAEKAGIVTHDVIVKIDRDLVKGRRGLVDLIGRRSPGDEVFLDIIHRGEPATKKVVLGERMVPPRSPRPRAWWRGRLKIGDDFNYEIPWGIDEWRNSLPGDLRERLEDGRFDETIRKHLEEAFKDFDSSASSRARSVVRVIEGDLDITVKSDDGERLVTVKKGGDTIAKDLPYEKLDTLPADVLEAVRELIEKHKVELIKPPSSGVDEVDHVDGLDRVKI
jgi:membrane-associated protease RseP (regulator of RpoE activity)